MECTQAVITTLIQGYLIHQANNQIPQEWAYTEGCVGITAYNLNRDSVTGKTDTDIDKNYQAFNDAIYKVGVINVIIQ